MLVVPGTILYYSTAAQAQAAYADRVQQMQQANSLTHPKPCRYCGQDDWGKHSCKRCGAPRVHPLGEGEK